MRTANGVPALARAGIDFEEGLLHMGGNEALYLRLLAKFPKDGNYDSFLACLGEGDLPGAKVHVHALKGLTANLAMRELHEQCRHADAMLKAAQVPDNLPRLEECYSRVADGIEEARLAPPESSSNFVENVIK